MCYRDLNESLKNVSTTNIHVFRHPSHRYKRNVVHGHMDLVGKFEELLRESMCAINIFKIHIKRHKI